MQEDLEGSSRRTNHERRIKINTVKMNQRRSLKGNSRRIPRKITQSFATIATNLVMSNKTANFPKNTPSTQIKAKER